MYHLDRKVYWDDETNGAIRIVGYTEAEIVSDAANMQTAKDLQRFFRLPDGSRKVDRLANTVTSLAREDPQHPPVYYVLSHLWARLFGTSVRAMRSLPAIFGIVSVICVFWLSLELFENREIAWIASALVAISPFFVLYSQEAREYSLWTVCVLTMCALFLRARRAMTLEAWSLYATVVLIAVYVYPFSALVAVAQGLYLLITEKPRLGRPFAYYSISCGGAFLLFLPWLRAMVTSSGLNRGMGTILTTSLSALSILAVFLRGVRECFIDLGVFRIGPWRSTPINLALTVVTTIVVSGAVIFLIRAKPLRTWGFVTIVLCLSVLPLLLHDLFFGGGLVYQTRYFIPLYLGAELSVAALIWQGLFSKSSTSRRALTGSLGVVLVAAGLLSCAISFQAQTWATKDFEENGRVATIVNTSPDAVVVSDFHTSRILSLGFYLDPAIKVRLNLQCDQCAVPPRRVDVLRALPSPRSIFLLAPSMSLLQEARDRKLVFQVIDGASIFPEVSGPLSMFDAVR